MAFKLASVSEVPEDKSLIVNGPNGMEIALISLKGVIYAFENECPHEGGPLGEGEVDHGCITCPWHGWRFDIATGECETMPGEEMKKLPIFIEEGVIYLL